MEKQILKIHKTGYQVVEEKLRVANAYLKTNDIYNGNWLSDIGKCL
jgi:hypothetical protein